MSQPPMEAVSLALTYINLACVAGELYQSDAQQALQHFRTWAMSGDDYYVSQIFQMAAAVGFPYNMIPGG